MIMPDVSDQFLNLLQTSMQQASAERQAQSAAFTAALEKVAAAHSADIVGLRKDVRYVLLVCILGVLSMAGVTVAVHNGALTFTPPQADTSSARN